jgi:DNA-binding MarR family transcriptional regulator
MQHRGFHLLERISALLRAEQRRAGAGMEPVHLAALSYLARANAFSDTPQAVGEYLGLTKGNVSQRLIWLERRGYLRKEPDGRDRRVVRLRLTALGEETAARLAPPEVWREAGGGGAVLDEQLEALLRRMLARRGFRTFGQCNTCRFHEIHGAGAYCGLLQLPLKAGQETRICREHEPAPVEA